MTTTPPQTEEELRERLRAPFDSRVLRDLSKGGKKFTYIPWPEVAERLDDCLGVLGWSRECKSWRDQHDPEEVIGWCRLTITFQGKTSTREASAGVKVKRYSEKSENAGKPLDLGDDFKSAESDAFKKAAQAFGVGRDLARKDEALAVEAEKNAAEESERLDREDPVLTAEEAAAIKEAIRKLPDDHRKPFAKWWTDSGIPKVDEMRRSWRGAAWSFVADAYRVAKLDSPVPDDAKEAEATYRAEQKAKAAGAKSEPAPSDRPTLGGVTNNGQTVPPVPVENEPPPEDRESPWANDEGSPDLVAARAESMVRDHFPGASSHATR